MSPVICLMGPTASGKTDLAMKAAKVLPLDIISVDSAMIYRGMDIGTGKPTPDELAQCPHALIDICDPDVAYSAQEFCQQATALIQQSHQKGRVPCLVGGTMLYFKALLEGLAPLPSACPKTRAQIIEQARTQGWMALHQRLQSIDPESAARIHPNDPQRIQRALEVYELSGQTLTALFSKTVTFLKDVSVLQVALMPEDKAWLHQRIEARFLKMLENGLVDELSHLLTQFDLDLNSPSLRCVGYRQVWQYLQGQIKHAEMVEQAFTATRQLAKRQITWLRAWPKHHQLFAENPDAHTAFISLIHDFREQVEFTVS